VAVAWNNSGVVMPKFSRPDSFLVFPTNVVSQFFDVQQHNPRGIMLYLIGLGLADETDITVKGLEIVKRADRVYLEAYTSILLVSKDKLVRR